MFQPISLLIGLRYIRAKRRNHFISFISLSSILGIALSVAALITTLSVMNGFRDAMQERIFSMARQVTVMSSFGGISDWPLLAKKIEEHPQVRGSAPYVHVQGLLSHAGYSKPTIVLGVDVEKQKMISEIEEHMLIGSFDDLDKERKQIILGERLARNINAYVGDKVTLIISEPTVSVAGVSPRFTRFTVAGIFDKNAGLGLDGMLAFITLDSAQKLLQLGESVSGINITIDNIYDAVKVDFELAYELGFDYSVTNWTSEFGVLFQAVRMEKTIMFLLLSLLIAIATFNLVSSLVMLVTDKQADIAILRTLGATPATIMRVFMIQGSLIGLIGTFLGILGGIMLSLNITSLVDSIESYFEIQIYNPDVYWTSSLPAILTVFDVMQVTVLALFLSFCATLYPAWRAARTQPAEALRYE